MKSHVNQDQIQHPNPVWRQRADYIIAATVDDRERPGRTEQLWARALSGHQYELCCIPFFLYGLSLGDLVETDSDHLVSRVVERSGRATFRAVLADRTSVEGRERLIRGLEASGALVERSPTALIAIDAIPQVRQAVEAVLRDYERAGDLRYEDGA